MRPDQIKRIKALTEDVAEVVITECDPNEWAGSGKTPSAMTKDERGDRVWDKKNAAATIAILQRLVSLTVDIATPHPGRGANEQDRLDKQAEDAEREANRMLRRVMGDKADAS